MPGILLSLAQTILPSIFGVIDKAVPDAAQAAQLKAQIQSQLLTVDASEFETQVKSLMAEEQGESWLQRNWRPITMLVFVFIIFNNYILAPYIGLFAPSYKLILDTPPDLWALIKIGLGGYVVGRSVEKSVAAWKGN